MEFGVFLLAQQRGYHQTSQQVINNSIEQTVMAEQAGFHPANTCAGERVHRRKEGSHLAGHAGRESPVRFGCRGTGAPASWPP